MEPVRHRGRGTTLVLLASVCFGSSGALAKPAMAAGLSPQQVASARIALAAVVLLVAVGLVRPALLRVRRGQWRVLLGYGLVGVAGVQLCYFISVSRIPVGIAMVVEFTAPILVALWVRFVRGTVLPALSWVGTVLALAGLAMVAQVWESLRLDPVGLLAGVAAALCGAAYFLLGEHSAGSFHPAGMVTWGMVVGALALCVVAPPWSIPVGLLDDPTSFGPWRPPVWVLLVAVAVLSCALAYLLGISALHHLSSTVASVLAVAEPIVATALAWYFLHEKLTPIQFVGAAVILGGAGLVQLASRRPLPGGDSLPIE